MPPVIRYDRQAVLSAAFRLVRRSGLNALNARAVAHEAGSSTQPIFRLYSGMDELKADVCSMAHQFYTDYLHTHVLASENVLLEYGIRYILFARDEPELFKLLFMCDRSHDNQTIGDPETTRAVSGIIEQMTGYSEEKAQRMIHWLWVFTHGLAVSMATRYLSYPEDALRRMLCMAFDMVQQRMNQAQP